MNDFLIIDVGNVDTLHDDLTLRIPSVNLNVVADTYYFSFDDPINEGDGEEQIVIAGLVEMLNGWRSQLEKLGQDSMCFLPFDFSDQYIGCFKFENIDKNINGTYGYTNKIGGWAIFPSKLSKFEIEDRDFIANSASFNIEKKELLGCIENSIKKLNDRPKV